MSVSADKLVQGFNASAAGLPKQASSRDIIERAVQLASNAATDGVDEHELGAARALESLAKSEAASADAAPGVQDRALLATALRRSLHGYAIGEKIEGALSASNGIDVHTLLDTAATLDAFGPALAALDGRARDGVVAHLGSMGKLTWFTEMLAEHPTPIEFSATSGKLLRLAGADAKSDVRQSLANMYPWARGLGWREPG